MMVCRDKKKSMLHSRKIFKGSRSFHMRRKVHEALLD